MNQQEKEDTVLINQHMYHNANSRKPPNKLLMGVGILFLGLIMAYFFIYLVAADVINHVDKVNYSYKAMMIAPFCIVLGTYYVFCRPTGANAWKDMEPIDKPFFVLALVLAVASIGGLWYWFEQLLKLHGYS
ncbi:MAG TPA: hypothetical protein PL131_09065 [Methylotenera sp.]|nr:hypothetical protein [Methylotenera sp.]HPH06011.1 hypothetical protein [Methylotenera sp.]HPN00589.1 hypothetical protein [Methylotenera sp.]